jgi:histidyl-tRNA synthetase
MRAILGGGRYDNLVQDVGGDALTGVGFAMGDVVLPLILQDYDLLPELNTSPGQILVTVFDGTVLANSLQISTELRDAGFNVQTYPEAEKLGKQFKYCDKEDIRYAVVAGPDEMLVDVIQVKDMLTREQVQIKRSDMVAYFHGLLED